MIWIQFFISTAVIVWAGVCLTVYADKLSDRMRWGKAWVGVLVLGLVTSLPEAVTSMVAVASLNAPDLAMGNIFGSNNFNPMLLVVMDLVYRKGAITNSIGVHALHTTSAVLAGILSLMAMAGIFWSLGTAMVWGIAVVYMAGMRYLGQIPPPETVGASSKTDSLKKIIVYLFISTILVIGGAFFLTSTADILAEQTGLGRTFFGSIFLALVTSLPEMVVSISALRMGSLDLAIGNIFGSNMTNIFIIVPCAIFYPQGAILNAVSSTHLLTGGLSLILVATAMVGIHWKNKKTFLGLGIDSFIMSILFLVGTKVLYSLK